MSRTDRNDFPAKLLPTFLEALSALLNGELGNMVLS